ncbi:MAG: ABC transporter permease [Candidatus Aminicenantes bacterium]|nr:ABC transporter permease [Candidatus Aminicenantes bacterium]
MRLISLLKKTMIENFRDWKIIILILFFAPFFVFLMYFYFGNTVVVYDVMIVNHDTGIQDEGGIRFYAGYELIQQLEDLKYPSGIKILNIHLEKNLDEAKLKLKDESADLIVEIPAKFSETLLEYKKGNKPPPVTVRTYGNASDVSYIMAAAWCDSLTYQYAAVLTNQESPLHLESESIGKARSLTDFELYVPGLLGLAVMMLMFSAAASVIKEKDKGTIIRLRLAKMKAWEWLSAVSLGQILIGLGAIGLTYLTAVSLGYSSAGSFFAAIVVCVFSCVSIMAVSMIVAAFLRSIFDLMTIGCFPFFLLMFFSGGLFPLPEVPLFTLGSHPVNLNAVLPTTHTIHALDRILNNGDGLEAVGFELAALAVLSVIYFTFGVWLFSRQHLRAK